MSRARARIGDYHVSVSGMRDIQKNLKRVSDKAERSVDTAVRRGGRVIAREAERLTERRTKKTQKSGQRLRGSFKVQKKKKGKEEARFVVGSTAPHFHLVELGTKAHNIFYTTRLGIRRLWFRHPGSRPEYILRDAAKRRAEAAEEEIGRYIMKKIEDAL